MAINAYTGLMGSGKSYEVTASVVVTAVEKGRRVVTNIDGISEEKIHDYLAKKGKERGKLGRVVHVTNDVLNKPGFFPDEHKPEQVTVVKPGDLVCIDEAWRHWGTGVSISTEHMQFFRMHRHYVDPETKVACDVALMVQHIGDLHRSIRSVVEMTARTTKIKTLGMNRTYRVELYEGDKITKASRFEVFVKKYDKAFFPLYNSYSGGQGTEKAMDKRQNVLLNPRIWFIGGMLLAMLAACVYYVQWYLHGRLKPQEAASAAEKTAGGVQSSPAGSGPANGAQKANEGVFRLVGEVKLHGESWMLVADSEGRVRLANPAAFVGRGLTMVGTVEGQRVATWTGTLKTQQQQSIVGGAK